MYCQRVLPAAAPPVPLARLVTLPHLVATPSGPPGHPPPSLAASSRHHADALRRVRPATPPGYLPHPQHQPAVPTPAVELQLSYHAYPGNNQGAGLQPSSPAEPGARLTGDRQLSLPSSRSPDTYSCVA
eukprot:gene5440-970_t